MNLRIIAIVNQKGGVGKTTSAVNLSSGLAMLGKKTLLIDMDHQANTSASLGVRPLDAENTICQLFIAPAETFNISTIILETMVDNLFLIPSHRNLSSVELDLPYKTNLDNRIILRERLSTVFNNYEFIIIDCPPSLNLLAINCLTCAKEILIPIKSEDKFSLDGIVQLHSVIASIKQNLNPGIEIMGYLPTFYSSATNLAKEILDQLKKQFDKQVFEIVIGKRVHIAEAPIAHQPVQLYAKGSYGARVYNELAKEVINRGKEKTIS
ncbi:MAG: AAA family ATPase [bacterium]